MKLTYNILWFENETEKINSQKQLIKTFLKEKHFKPVITIEKKYDEKYSVNTDLLNEFDLILIDYSLENNETGDVIIEKIRNLECYSVILFYSGDYNNLIRSINSLERPVQGVFHADRDDIIERIKLLIDRSINKVEDIINLRGLFLSETSNIENELREILLLIEPLYKNKDAIKSKINKKLLEILKSNLKSNKEFYDLISEENFIEIINHRCIDFVKKFKILREICKKLGTCINTKEFLCKTKDYQDDITDLRNALAHCREQEKDGKKILKSHFKNNEPISFDKEMFKDSRKTLIDYQEEIESLKTKIDAYIDSFTKIRSSLC